MTSAAAPELVIAAGSVQQAERYIRAGADAVLVGEPRFSLRQPGSVTADELKKLVPLAHGFGAKVYVNVNKLFYNDELAALPAYLRTVAEAGADAAVFSDPAVLLNAREHAPDLALHWHGDMTGTSSAAAAFWGRYGAGRAVLARELNEAEIADICRSTDLEIQVQVHGMTNIYYSRRNLLESYMEHLGRPASLIRRGPDRGLFLVELERPDQKLPVYEDENGTYVMSPDDICLLEALPDLVAYGVDSFYVEPLLKTEDYNVTVLQIYRAALDRIAAQGERYEPDPAWMETIRRIQDPDREMSFGFLYKEQVY